MKPKAPFKQFFFLIVFISLFYELSLNAQTNSKVQKLYESEKYLKCLKLSNQNLKKGVDKLNSSLYKSLSVIELYDNSKLNEIYKYPLIEALKGIQKIEKYKIKNPSDYFHSENRYRIDKVLRFVEKKADSLYVSGDFKNARKVFAKFKDIYPENDYFFYKYCKSFNFNTGEILSLNKSLSEEILQENLFEVLSASKNYFKNNFKKELKEDLDILYNEADCDLQILSTILVFSPEEFKEEDYYKQYVDKFKQKYWQIKMLYEVNDIRAGGYACGGLLIDPRPPLILSNCLCRAAQKYAELMQRENFFSHTGKDGSTPWQRAENEGCRADAENIADNLSQNTSDVLKQWMSSEEHCKNITGFHQKTGFGNAGSLWVQMFY